MNQIAVQATAAVTWSPVSTNMMRILLHTQCTSELERFIFVVNLPPDSTFPPAEAHTDGMVLTTAFYTRFNKAGSIFYLC